LFFRTSISHSDHSALLDHFTAIDEMITVLKRTSSDRFIVAKKLETEVRRVRRLLQGRGDQGKI
jgi:hypothetical protein